MNSERDNRRLMQSRNFYCGDDTTLPRDYWRFGTRRECLSRGVGLGLYVVPEQKEKRERERLEYKRRKDKLEREKNRIRGFSEIYREREQDIQKLHRLDDDLKNKRVYQQFIFSNFDKAKRNSRDLESGEIFKKLARLWKIEQRVERKELRRREKSRNRELRRR